MSIRIGTQNYQAGVMSSQSQQSNGAVSFADVLQEKAVKQKSVTLEQANRLRDKYMRDRYLTPQDAVSMVDELKQFVELDADKLAALPTLQQARGKNGDAWNQDAFFQYHAFFVSISVDMQGATSNALTPAPTFMEALLKRDAYSWTNEWGLMGMLPDSGKVTQLGPGINLNSKGDRQLSAQEIDALKEKYMADGTLSSADAKFLIGELSSKGAIDGQLAWDLIMGETFSRDFSQPRQASLLADEERWDLDALLEYLWQKHLAYKEKADAETDMSLWEQYKHASEQREKLHGIFQMMMGA